MSSFFGIFWYICPFALSWTKTSIKTAYTTFINSLETQADNTVEKDRKFTIKEQRRGKPHQPELCPLSHYFKTILSKGSQIQSLHPLSRCG